MIYNFHERNKLYFSNNLLLFNVKTKFLNVEIF